jgi:hypothetical protein
MFDETSGNEENEVSKFILQQAFDKLKATIAKDLPDREILQSATDLWDIYAVESEKNEKSDLIFVPMLIDTLKFIRDKNPSVFDLFREEFDNERIAAIIDNLPGASDEDDDPELTKQAEAWDDEIDLLLNEIEILNSGE